MRCILSQCDNEKFDLQKTLLSVIMKCTLSFSMTSYCLLFSFARQSKIGIKEMTQSEFTHHKDVCQSTFR